jgi:hypothetical protein
MSYFLKNKKYLFSDEISNMSYILFFLFYFIQSIQYIYLFLLLFN